LHFRNYHFLLFLFLLQRLLKTETTSLGAAYLAGIGVGYWKNTDEVKKYWSVDRVFSPKISGEKAQVLYKGWHEAVKRTLTHYPAV
ncbi:MAG: hypothetical protein KKH77_04155, partial [Candidatus Omnitrophica bacterium]|nr:hypothetical protein [Candidatus Omnitrophota bacterium]